MASKWAVDSDPRVATTICGFSKLAQAEEASKAFDVGAKALDASVLASVATTYEKHVRQHVHHRW